MLELSGSQFARGVLELRLEDPGPRSLQWLLQLGPIRGRVLALMLLLSSSLTHVLQQPAKTLLEWGWVQGSASSLQAWMSWPLFGLGLVLYVLVFVLRRETLLLTVDRTGQELRYIWIPRFARSRVKEGLIPFSQIKEIHVAGPHRDPVSPHGRIRFEVPTGHPALEFQVLSDEQAKFYPLNLGKLTSRPVVGDWVDPES